MTQKQEEWVGLDLYVSKLVSGRGLEGGDGEICRGSVVIIITLSFSCKGSIVIGFFIFQGTVENCLM